MGFMRIGALTVFVALAALLDRALAQGDRNAETPRGRARSREGGMNDLMRRLLWLPEQASTFAPKVDYAALLRHHGDDDRLDRDRR